MLGIEALRDELARTTYKPGWAFTLYEHRGGEGIWLSIRADLEDAYHPGSTVAVNINTAVPPIPDVDYFHAWLNYRLDRIEGHERREWYRIGGAVRDDPHAPGANESADK